MSETYNEDYFAIDFSCIDIEVITDEDAAISVLFGCEVEPFKSWLLMASGNLPFENRGADENAFWEACRKYYGSGSSLDDGGLLYYYYKSIKSLGVWRNDFIMFAEALYNGGVIYHENTRSFLVSNGAKLEYLEDSWAYKFYQIWLERDLWTLEQAACLFKGQCPDAGRNYLDFSQEAYSSYCADWIRNRHTGKLDTKISDVIQDSIDAKKLYLASNRDGQLRFEPKCIVQWFVDKTGHTPPKPLLDLLNLNQAPAVTEPKFYNLLTMKKNARERVIMNVALEVDENNPNEKIGVLKDKIKVHPSVRNEKIVKASWKTYLKPVTRKRLDKESAQKRA